MKRKILSLEAEKTEIRELEVTEDKKEKQNSWAVIGLVGELGFSIAIPIAGGAVLGKYLDERFGTSPRLTLSFIFLGIFIGLMAGYQVVMKEFKS